MKSIKDRDKKLYEEAKNDWVNDDLNYHIYKNYKRSMSTEYFRQQVQEKAKVIINKKIFGNKDVKPMPLS